MIKSDDRAFLQAQIVETDRLLEMTGDHPLMAPPLRQRADELREKLKQLPSAQGTPRAVLFFAGGPVQGANGIDAQFATSVLQPYLEMVKTQYTATKHGHVGARGRRRDESEARLLLTGMPRGSFGLELSQPNQEDFFSAETLSEVLVCLTEVIRSAAENDEGFAHAFEATSPRVLDRLRDFFKVVADNEASLRIVSGDLECSLDQERVASALDRVSKTETTEDVVEKSGTFRGATLDSWRFDFRSDDGMNLSGRLGEEVSDEQAADMLRLTNKPCLARLRETIVTTGSGVARSRCELLALTETYEDFPAASADDDSP